MGALTNLFKRINDALLLVQEMPYEQQYAGTYNALLKNGFKSNDIIRALEECEQNRRAVGTDIAFMDKAARIKLVCHVMDHFDYKIGRFKLNTPALSIAN